jgi:hypothetical protein
MAPSEQQLLWKALRLRRPAGSDVSPIQAALASFDARNANATVLNDHWMIFRLIASSFAEPTDVQLERTLRGSLASVSSDAADMQLRAWTEEHAAAFERFNALVRSALERALQAMSWQLGGMQMVNVLASVPRRATLLHRQPGDVSPPAALSGRFDPAKRLTAAASSADLLQPVRDEARKGGTVSGPYEWKDVRRSSLAPARPWSGSFDYHAPRLPLEPRRSRIAFAQPRAPGELLGAPALAKIDSAYDPSWPSASSPLEPSALDAGTPPADAAAVDEPAVRAARDSHGLSASAPAPQR